MHRAFVRLSAFAFAATTALLAGCAGNKGACCDDSAGATKSPDAKVTVVNTLCPIGNDDFGSKERTPDLARTWNNQSIGFCCESCVKQFDKMTAEGKNSVASAAAANKAIE